MNVGVQLAFPTLYNIGSSAQEWSTVIKMGFPVNATEISTTDILKGLLSGDSRCCQVDN